MTQSWSGSPQLETTSTPRDNGAGKSAGFKPGLCCVVGRTVRSATFTRVAEASAARSVSLETGAPGALVDCSHDTVGSDK